MNKAEIESAALQAFRAYLADVRGEEWIPDPQPRPDEIERNRPSYDYRLTEARTGVRSALEITQFTWPLDRNTTSHRLKALAADISVLLKSEVTGTFTVGVQINAVTTAGVFAPTKRKKAKADLVHWFRTEGSQMEVGATAFADGVPGMRVTRQSLDGTLNISIPVATTRIAYPDWIDSLEPVLLDNARKFEEVDGDLNWLLVVDPGMVGRLEITGPVLKVPPIINELFFIDYWPPASKDVFSYQDVKPRTDGAVFHRETGAITVAIPSRH